MLVFIGDDLTGAVCVLRVDLSPLPAASSPAAATSRMVWHSDTDSPALSWNASH